MAGEYTTTLNITPARNKEIDEMKKDTLVQLTNRRVEVLELNLGTVGGLVAEREGIDADRGEGGLNGDGEGVDGGFGGISLNGAEEEALGRLDVEEEVAGGGGVAVPGILSGEGVGSTEVREGGWLHGQLNGISDPERVC